MDKLFVSDWNAWNYVIASKTEAEFDIKLSNKNSHAVKAINNQLRLSTITLDYGRQLYYKKLMLNSFYKDIYIYIYIYVCVCVDR